MYIVEFLVAPRKWIRSGNVLTEGTFKTLVAAKKAIANEIDLDDIKYRAVKEKK